MKSFKVIRAFLNFVLHCALISRTKLLPQHCTGKLEIGKQPCLRYLSWFILHCKVLYATAIFYMCLTVETAIRLMWLTGYLLQTFWCNLRDDWISPLTMLLGMETCSFIESCNLSLEKFLCVTHSVRLPVDSVREFLPVDCIFFKKL